MLKNGETYYLNASEIASSIQKYDSDLYQSYSNNTDALSEIDSFADDSVNVLIGDTWDAIRSNLNNYMDCAKASSDLNKLINEVNKECLQMIQKFLGSDSELNTADLPKFEAQRDSIKQQMEALKEKIESLKAELNPPPEICTTDDKGYEHCEPDTATIAAIEDAIAIAQSQYDDLSYELDQVNQAIDKINTFNDVILPQINEKLDFLQDKIIRFENLIDMLGTSNANLLKRYLTFNADFYYDKTGKPYAVYYPKSNIYIDLTDPDNPKYSRYDPVTNTYSNISIFDMQNIDSAQYGASQKAFYNFNELINDSKIWEEMQKYYPVESFNSMDDAMEFYEKYFTIVAKTGCGYAASTDFVFQSYEGKEDEFEKTFGYPMYTVDKNGNIDFNYEQFMLGQFNYNLVNNKGIDTVEEFSSTYELVKSVLDKQYLQEDYANANLFEKIGIKFKLASLDSKLSSIPFDRFDPGAIIADGNGYLDEYLASFGIDTNYEFSENDYNINKGSIIGCFGYTLKDGNEVLFENGSGHTMYVTGYTDNGELLVSSWGKPYNLDPKTSEYLTVGIFSIQNS